MFERTKIFFRTTLLGGILVILPGTILILALKWLFGMLTHAIDPLTNLLQNRIMIQRWQSDLLVILIILSACFFVGLFVRTRLGRLVYEGLEGSVLVRAPGYKLIKETINQFFGKKKSPFSSVALVRIFENDTRVTAFVTDESADGSRVTVFVPTGPNPTSGFIYHVDAQFVECIDASIEDTMRTVISCGTGSAELLYSRQENTDN